jgi:hypothetical protein
VTELHRRRDQDRAGFNNRIARAWQQLMEEVARPAYWELANRLPGFEARHPVEVAMLRSLVRLPSAYPGEAWGGMIIAPGSAGVRVDVGVFLRLNDQAGRCTIAAVVDVNRHHQGRGLTVSVLEQVFQTTISTAHFNTTLTKIRNALASCVPRALTTLEDALEAERQLAAKI